jgi:hypothetical protein
MRLGQAMIGKLGALSGGQKVVLPVDLTNVDGMLRGVALDTTTATPVPRPRPAAPPLVPAPEPVPVVRPLPATIPTMPAVSAPFPPPKPE